MRTLAALVATSFVALAVASVASASPTISLVWTGTTGTGTTGSSSINANVGDTLALDIRINIDNTGLSAAGVTLAHNTTELLADLGYGAGPSGTTTSICPNPPNPMVELCAAFSDPVRFYSSLYDSSFLTDSFNGTPGQLGWFNALKSSAPYATNGTMTLGRAIFHVTSGSNVIVSVANVPLWDSVNDASGNAFFPTASATVIVPEPGTSMSVGIACTALACLARARRRAGTYGRTNRGYPRR